MEANYSVLYFKENLDSHYNEIRQLLQKGVKIFWFGSVKDVSRLNLEYKLFSEAFFIQAFSVEDIVGVDIIPNIIITDRRSKEWDGQNIMRIT